MREKSPDSERKIQELFVLDNYSVCLAATVAQDKVRESLRLNSGEAN